MGEGEQREQRIAKKLEKNKRAKGERAARAYVVRAARARAHGRVESPVGGEGPDEPVLQQQPALGPAVGVGRGEELRGERRRIAGGAAEGAARAFDRSSERAR